MLAVDHSDLTFYCTTRDLSPPQACLLNLLEFQMLLLKEKKMLFFIQFAPIHEAQTNILNILNVNKVQVWCFLLSWKILFLSREGDGRCSTFSFGCFL